MATVTIDKGWSWAVPIGGFIANFIIGGFAKSYGIIMTSTQELYDSSATPLTLAGGMIYAFMYCLSLVGILLSEKYGCRSIINIGAIGCIASFICAFFSTTITTWVICIGGGVGVSLAFIYSIIFVMIGKCFRKRAGLALGISVSGVSVGQMACPFFISFITDKYGARGSMLIAAGIVSHFLITAALMPRYIREDITEQFIYIAQRSVLNFEEKIPGKKREYIQMKNLNKESTFKNIHISMLIIYAIAKIFADVGDVGMAIILPPYGKSILELSMQEMSFAIGLGGGVDLIARIVIGTISDNSWCRRSLVLIIAWFLEALNTFVFLWFPNKSTYYICYGIFGLCSGTSITLMIVVLIDLVGQVNLTSSFSLMMFTSGIFIVLGQFIVGYLADLTSDFIWSIRFLGIMLFMAFFILSLEYPIKKFYFNTTASNDIIFQNTLHISKDKMKEVNMDVF